MNHNSTSIWLLIILFTIVTGCENGSTLVDPLPVEVELASKASGNKDIRLVSICAGIWRVDNLTADDQTFRWQHVASTMEGTGVVEAEKRIYFRTQHDEEGPNTTKLFDSEGQQDDVKASNNNRCHYSLSGTVYNDANENGSQEAVELPIPDLTLVLIDKETGDEIARTRTDASGIYIFADTQFPQAYLFYDDTYTISIPSMTPDDQDVNEVIVPYYIPTFPTSLPHSFTRSIPNELGQEGGISDTFGVEVQHFGLTLDPLALTSGFQENDLPTDIYNDHFWWQQMKRALGGRGTQRNSHVKKHELERLLDIIENGNEDIDNLFDQPFTFGANPIRAAEAILRPPANRNRPQSNFESALLTVWLNRVYGTNINTTLLDGLLLASEQAWVLEQSLSTGKRSQSTSLLQTSSLSLYEETLRSSYRSGTGGTGSN